MTHLRQLKGFLLLKIIFSPFFLTQSSSFFFCLFFTFFFFWPHFAAHTILVSQPEMGLAPPAVKAWNLNHWTASAVPILLIFKELV